VVAVEQSNQSTEQTSKGIEKLLGELELAIMQIVWKHKTVTVRDVLEALVEQRPLAYTTVMTVMGRLVDKGMLVADKQNKSYNYRAVRTPEELESHTVNQVVQGLLTDFSGDLIVRQFVEQLSVADPAQLARLAELARQAQEEQDHE
jgi:predicted transcriptional regulator